MFEAIKYLHDNQIAHRDINLKNILISKVNDNGTLHIKLVDFGCARYLPEGQAFTRYQGQDHYVAPEIVNHMTHDEKIDIWSATVCIYTLLSGELPFQGDDEDEIFEQIKNKEIDFESSDWNHISNQAKRFL